MICIVPLVIVCAFPTPSYLICHVAFPLCNQSLNNHIKVQLEGIISRHFFIIIPFTFWEREWSRTASTKQRTKYPAYRSPRS